MNHTRERNNSFLSQSCLLKQEYECDKFGFKVYYVNAQSIRVEILKVLIYWSKMGKQKEDGKKETSSSTI